MKPTAPDRIIASFVCHNTLPWLISFSLDGLTVYFPTAHSTLRIVVTVSTLQRVQMGTAKLLYYADVACMKTKLRTKHSLFQVQMKMWR
jgi:hypothetical protein